MLFGITNSKFDCYRNSVIQSIIRVPPLMKFFGNQFFESQQSPLSFRLFKLAVAVCGNTAPDLRSKIMPKNQDGTVDLTSFNSVLDKITKLQKFGYSEIQHDAVEFLGELLNILSRELIDINKQDEISKLIGIRLENSIKCAVCGKINLIKESDLMLKLSLKGSLVECIESFEKSENVEWKCDFIDCPSYNQVTTAIKQITITRIPDCFIII